MIEDIVDDKENKSKTPIVNDKGMLSISDKETMGNEYNCDYTLNKLFGTVPNTIDNMLHFDANIHMYLLFVVFVYYVHICFCFYHKNKTRKTVDTTNRML